MEAELLVNIRGNVQLLRDIWNARMERADQPSPPHAIRSPGRRPDYKQFSLPPDRTIITSDADETRNRVRVASSIVHLFRFFRIHGDSDGERAEQH